MAPNQFCGLSEPVCVTHVSVLGSDRRWRWCGLVSFHVPEQSLVQKVTYDIPGRTAVYGVLREAKKRKQEAVGLPCFQKLPRFPVCWRICHNTGGVLSPLRLRLCVRVVGSLVCVCLPFFMVDQGCWHSVFSCLLCWACHLFAVVCNLWE